MEERKYVVKTEEDWRKIVNTAYEVMMLKYSGKEPSKTITLNGIPVHIYELDGDIRIDIHME